MISELFILSLDNCSSGFELSPTQKACNLDRIFAQVINNSNLNSKTPATHNYPEQDNNTNSAVYSKFYVVKKKKRQHNSSMS